MKQMYDVFLRDGVSVGALDEIKGSFGTLAEARAFLKSLIRSDDMANYDVGQDVWIHYGRNGDRLDSAYIYIRTVWDW